MKTLVALLLFALAMTATAHAKEPKSKPAALSGTNKPIDQGMKEAGEKADIARRSNAPKRPVANSDKGVASKVKTSDKKQKEVLDFVKSRTKPGGSGRSERGQNSSPRSGRK